MPKEVKWTQKSMSDKIMDLLIGLSWLIAAGVVVLFIIGQFVYKHDILIKGESKTIDSEWTYETTEGDTGTCVMPCRIELSTGEGITLTTTMPDDIEDGMYMYLLIGRDCDIYIDGELRSHISGEDMEFPGRVVKSEVFPIKLYAADRGKKITMVKDELKVFNGNFNAINYGVIYEMNMEFFGEYGLRFVLALILMVLALAICLFSIGTRIVLHKKKEPMQILSYGVFVVALWIITDSYMYQYAFNNIYVDGLVSYMLTLLIPISFIRYENEVQHHRYQKMYNIVMAVLLVSNIVFTVLHFTDTVSFGQSLLLIDIILALSIVVMCIFLVRDLIQGYTIEYKELAVGILGLVIFSVIEIIMINAHQVKYSGAWVIFGVYFLVGCAVVYSIKEIVRREHEKQDALNANRIKTDFLANMSHEIRTPINSIMGMNEMIMRESKDADISQYSEHIKRSCDLLLSIIGDVLDFSKIETGKINIVRDPYNTATLIGDITTFFQEQASANSLKTEIDVDADIPTALDGDENHIKQILINLITNANKYTRSGTVGFMAYVSGEYPDGRQLPEGECMLCFEVSDTGIGIKRDDLNRLFDSFTRVDERKNKGIQGTGLGLAIVKSLTDAMGGTVTVNSKYGEGSTFIVKIPQKVISAAPIDEKWKNVHKEDKAAGEYKASFTAPDARILAVDDNSSNLLIIKQLLKATEVGIELVDNGAEAIELAACKAYDLILLDHMMPDPDGEAVLKAIKRDKTGVNYRTPVIVLTANATSESKAEYLAMGFDDYISKPVDGATLEETIRKYINESDIKTDMTKDKVAEDKASAVSSSNAGSFGDNAGVVTKEADPSDAGEPVKAAAVSDDEIFAKVVKVYGNEDFAKQIISTVAKDSLDRLKTMKEDIEAGDYADYAICAHGIKGMMASIYKEDLKERSKEHEFAAKEGRYDYIKEDYERYAAEIGEYCRKIMG